MRYGIIAFLATIVIIVGVNVGSPEFVSAAVPENGPGGLALAVIGPFEIDLSWKAVPSEVGATGYKIERESPIGGGFSIVAIVSAVSTTYADKNLTPGKIYNYRISTINAAGVSPPSPGLTALGTPDTVAPTPPGKPVNVTAAAVSGTAVNLLWTAPQSASSISGYKIEREVSSGYTLLTVTTSTATSYADTGLSSNAVYSYRVTAINTGYGEGNVSDAASVFTPVRPGAPQSVNAVAGDSQATITWTAPFYAGGNITGYIITGKGTSSVTVGSSTLSATITGLTNDTGYSFAVAAVNPAGQGPFVAANAVTPKAPLSLVQASSSTASSTLPASSTAPAPVPSATPIPIAALPQITRVATTTATTFSFQRNLWFGSEGNDVKALQLLLVMLNAGPKAKKLSVAGPNGYFGYATKYALAEYQKKAGITPAAGTFGPKTRAHVNSVLKTR